jgi:hypothetical protein
MKYAGWQMVTCSGCGRKYRCTPMDDYYNNTTFEDGVCEKCLLEAAGMDPRKLVTVTKK